MTEREASVLNKLHGCSGWLKRAQKYHPYLEHMPAAGNNALFQGLLCVEEAIKILLGGKEDGNDGSK